jgi:hypothetical protein
VPSGFGLAGLRQALMRAYCYPWAAPATRGLPKATHLTTANAVVALSRDKTNFIQWNARQKETSFNEFYKHHARQKGISFNEFYKHHARRKGISLRVILQALLQGETQI